MEYLILSVLSSTLIFLIFRLFSKYEIDNFQAIVFNYVTASLIGYGLSDTTFSFSSAEENGWMSMAIVMGILFISMFNVIAVTTQKIGVAVASVASKVSLVIPALLAVYLYNDEMPMLKIVGIILAVGSVYLTFYSKDGGSNIGVRWLFPVILFLGTGLLDTLMKFTQSTLLSEEQFSIFSAMLFAVAGLIGLVVMLIRMAVKKGGIKLKNVVAGIALGVPNYGSIYFLLQSFEHINMESSVIIPINNMGIVAASALAAFVIFRERLSPLNWAGIGISILAIGIIAYA